MPPTTGQVELQLVYCDPGLLGQLAQYALLLEYQGRVLIAQVFNYLLRSLGKGLIGPELILYLIDYIENVNWDSSGLGGLNYRRCGLFLTAISIRSPAISSWAM